MGKINTKFPELEEYSKSIFKIVRDINSNPNFNRNEKKQAIKVLEGLIGFKRAEVINKNFKRPIDTDDIHTKDESLPLDEDIAEVISEDRPKEFKGDTTTKRK